MPDVLIRRCAQRCEADVTQPRRKGQHSHRASQLGQVSEPAGQTVLGGRESRQQRSDRRRGGRGEDRCDRALEVTYEVWCPFAGAEVLIAESVDHPEQHVSRGSHGIHRQEPERAIHRWLAAPPEAERGDQIDQAAVVVVRPCQVVQAGTGQDVDVASLEPPSLLFRRHHSAEHTSIPLAPPGRSNCAAKSRTRPGSWCA